jgi:pyrroline-5-carboxylate reductase
MGEAILNGLLNSSVYAQADIQVTEIIEGRREHILKTYGVKCYQDVMNPIAFGDVVIIAVKPGDIEDVLKQIKPILKPEQVLISIAAGVTLEFFHQQLSNSVPIVRVMPNLACSVGEAMIAYCPSGKVAEKQLTMVIDVLSLLGKTTRLDEKYLNLATGLVGSGPAYIFLIIDALADAGVRLGLPKEIAILLAAQTTLGAAKLVVETNEHPVKLKDMVATPAGTTVEGLLELEKGKLRAVIISAVTKATKRAKGLQPS